MTKRKLKLWVHKRPSVDEQSILHWEWVILTNGCGTYICTSSTQLWIFSCLLLTFLTTTWGLLSAPSMVQLMNCSTWMPKVVFWSCAKLLTKSNVQSSCHIMLNSKCMCYILNFSWPFKSLPNHYYVIIFHYRSWIPLKMCGGRFDSVQIFLQTYIALKNPSDRWFYRVSMF